MTQSIVKSLNELRNLPKPKYALTINSLGLLSSVLNAAHDLDLYKYLKDKSVTLEQLADTTKTNRVILGKILNILSRFGFIEQLDNKTFTSNQTTEQLNFLDHSFLGNKAERALCNLHESLQTGELPWDITYNKSFYETLGEDQKLSEAFYDWHLKTAETWLYPLIPHYNFAQFDTLIDLGGGQGCFINEVLKQNPSMNGILFERPEAVEAPEVKENLSEVLERCKIMGGDLTQTVPEGGDAYCLNRVLLNLSDELALQVLQNCKAAMKPGAKLIIIDVIAESSNEDSSYPFFLLNDLRLYLLMGGRHRNKMEWEELLKKASFNNSEIHSFGDKSFLSILEAAP